jgi:hypothetical protein
LTDTSQDERDYFNPGQSPNGQYEDDEETSASFDYGALFDAPDFSSMVRGRRAAGAREYETKVKSVLKSGAVAALRAGNLPDAATILHFGPGFSAAAGDLAAVNDPAKRAIDLITAPDNPFVTFALVALPFVGQLFRNHEETFRQIPEVRRMARRERKMAAAAEDTRKNLELKLPFGRVIRFRVGLRLNSLKRLRLLFHLPTREPQDLVTQVFSDEKLIAALDRQGIRIVVSKV